MNKSRPHLHNPLHNPLGGVTAIRSGSRGSSWERRADKRRKTDVLLLLWDGKKIKKEECFAKFSLHRRRWNIIICVFSSFKYFIHRHLRNFLLKRHVARVIYVSRHRHGVLILLPLRRFTETRKCYSMQENVFSLNSFINNIYLYIYIYIFCTKMVKRASGGITRRQMSKLNIANEKPLFIFSSIWMEKCVCVCVCVCVTVKSSPKSTHSFQIGHHAATSLPAVLHAFLVCVCVRVCVCVCVCARGQWQHFLFALIGREPQPLWPD